MLIVPDGAQMSILYIVSEPGESNGEVREWKNI